VKPRAYYNENDPYAAQWLRNLMARGLIMDGEVDERSITEVAPADLDGFVRAHFFAGIGGWDYALTLARWPADRPVWTGSCPCQPFSNAGKRQGVADERHLWPEWFRLIAQCRPPVVFGEQVEAAIRAGWLDVVSADLEGEGYSLGATVLGAHSTGAPHIRQRAWFVADSDHQRRAQHAQLWQEAGGRNDSDITEATWGGAVGDSALADSNHPGLERWIGSSGRCAERVVGPGSLDGDSTLECPYALGVASAHWGGCEWVACSDGKARPVEPGSFPLAHGVPGRVGRLRAYGNAIVPQVAAEFITAYMEVGDAD
jgi:DNA (cytosine-5)-methyltransferase 1